jgi:hypothetical protein
MLNPVRWPLPYVQPARVKGSGGDFLRALLTTGLLDCPVARINEYVRHHPVSRLE